MLQNLPANKYKWYVLGLGTTTHMLALSLPYMAMPVLFKEISDKLSLSLVQIGTIWGISELAVVFTAVLWGLVGDKLGTRYTIGLACILQGVACALRGTATDFTTLAVFSFMFGLFRVPMLFTVHKAAGEWFSGRQLGFANGVLAGGVGVGNMLATMLSATVLSPLRGGWSNTLYLIGAISVLFGIFWLVTGRKPIPVESQTETKTVVSFKQALFHTVRIKGVWLLAATEMCYAGFIAGIVGFLPLYLRNSGWSNLSADATLAVLSIASLVGVIPLAALSDKIGLRKTIVYVAFFVTIVATSLLSIFGVVVVWGVVILVGIFREVVFSNVITMNMETKGVGRVYAGTSLGIALSVGGLGGFLSPQIGNRLANINPTYGFIFWGVLVVAATCVFYFARETGWKKRETPANVELAGSEK
jgi:MFS family permease